ncbi:cuticle protein 10.9 [Nephila pilipes]|uniref:Cuticle protein 10.9 n=1 Tax=Nephila pilipes TaxID=299642 RepID=A0A8X6TVJ3_NEPPI|nr:cuticle protein 10.9 [Nephila pilipes]
MFPVASLLLLIVSTAALALPLQKVKTLGDVPQKIVKLIEFSTPSSPQVIEFVPNPYQFGYEFGDGHGMKQHRSESADEQGVVKGTYGYVDPLGVYRSVEYIADSQGYRAVIKTNEPGASANDIAHGHYIVETPPAAVLEQGLLFQRNRNSREQAMPAVQ